MADIEAVVDERGANIVMNHAQAALGVIHKNGSGHLGPFPTTWNANAFFTGGQVDLIPPNVIRLVDFEMHYSVHFAVMINLNQILPPIALYFPCITIKIFGKKIKICPPPVPINWPTVTIPVGHSDMIKVTSDFTVQTHLDNANYWHIEAVIVGVPFLQLGVGTSAILTALGLAASAVLAPLPFVGPFLAGAVAVIMATIGIAGVTGFLGPILSLFVTGLRFPISVQPKNFQVLPATSSIDPKIEIGVDALVSSVIGTNEDELWVGAYISPVI
jgi:hypothetical protein